MKVTSIQFGLLPLMGCAHRPTVDVVDPITGEDSFSCSSDTHRGGGARPAIALASPSPHHKLLESAGNGGGHHNRSSRSDSCVVDSTDSDIILPINKRRGVVSMGKPRIRKANVKDAARVLAAFREIARDSQWILTEPSEIAKTVKEEAEFIRQFRKSKNSLFVVAEMDGEIVGLSSIDGGKHKRNKHVGTIGIAVRKDWRGIGIGNAMMQYLIKWAKKAGVKKLRSSVFAKNQGAIDLFIKFGFKKEGLLKREMKIGYKYYDIVEFAKHL
jgi:RimJ/RimL family protein N-acetyltransferase